MMYRVDMYFKTDPELSAISAEFAQDNTLFLQELSEAWYMLMNADMFAGPTGSQCGYKSSGATNIVISNYFMILTMLPMLLINF